jgi:hypothetical protein
MRVAAPAQLVETAYVASGMIMFLLRLKQAVRTFHVCGVVHRLREDVAVGSWLRQGCPVPPPHLIKQSIIRSYAAEYHFSTLIETGTFLGDMVAATRGSFSRIYSIELDEELHRLASRRFADDERVTILRGDSATVLRDVLSHLDTPALFWLDAHYSGGPTARGSEDSPIIHELELVLTHRIDGHGILIDDARCFIGRDGYPTLRELKHYLHNRRIDYKCDIAHDVIRIFPQD